LDAIALLSSRRLKPAATFGLYFIQHILIRNYADKTKRLIPYILELMDFIRRNVDNVAKDPHENG
jgi:hypothetical protein